MGVGRESVNTTRFECACGCQAHLSPDLPQEDLLFQWMVVVDEGRLHDLAKADLQVAGKDLQDDVEVDDDGEVSVSKT